MRKSLLFIAALCATVALNAKTITLEPGSGKIAEAVASAEAGDIIELTGDGTAEYVEGNSIKIDKAITIRAAEGATPVVHIMKFKMDAAFAVEGIEFYGYEDYMFRTETGGEFALSFKNCLIRNSSAYFIYISDGQTIDALTIDNCIFKDNTKNENCVVYGRGTISNFEMRNSTVMNCLGNYAVRVYSGENFVVDHCTFANVGMQALRLAETTKTSTAIAVSNCVIFSETATTDYAYYVYNGTLTNSVYFNSPTPGYRSGLTVNKIINADPQFVDPANGNLNFAFTSPLFLAATDGSNIGDPRWGVAEPETAIAVPDTLPAMQAVLSGTKISATEDGIKWNDNSANPDDNSASWVIDVNKTGIYKLIINDTTGSGHTYIVSVANAEGWLYTKTQTEDAYTKGNHVFDAIIFNKVGKYMVCLKNGTQYSSSVANKIYLDYLGGAVVDVPASLPIEDAIVNGPRVSKAEGGLKWNNSSDDASSFVTWNVNVTKAGDYEVVVNENTEFGHNYSVTIENDQETLPDVGEGTTVWKSGDISLGIISIANTGVYTIKLTNTTLNSTSLTNSLSLNYIGGGIVNVPGILPAEDALLGGKVIRLENGSVKWPDKKDVDNHYVTWNINATVAGDVDVIAHIGVPPVGEDASSHNFTATLYQGETAISSIPEPKKTSTTGEITFGTLNIPEAGVYALRLTNAVEWSSAIVDALELKEAQVIETIEIGDDQTDVDFTAYAGQTVNIKLNRTIKADMFTPFCLPFVLHSGALNSVLKSDKAYVLDDAQIQDQTLSVKLQTYSSIYQGTPFLIKPTEEVVDPIFENVTIMDDPQASSTTKGNVTFQGSFAKENLTESDKVLLVGNNNTLFYPNDATPYIKSMRAYFRVNVAANMLPRFAAFVEPGNAPTEMIIVGGEAERQKGHRKVLVDGQIRIQHEGKCYSILGLER